MHYLFFTIENTITAAANPLINPRVPIGLSGITRPGPSGILGCVFGSIGILSVALELFKTMITDISDKQNIAAITIVLFFFNLFSPKKLSFLHYIKDRLNVFYNKILEQCSRKVYRRMLELINLLSSCTTSLANHV